MLASMFVYGGLDQVRHPDAKLPKAGPVIDQLKGPLHLPDDPATLVRANGAAMVGAGTLLALGRFPRVAALVLAGTLVPTTYAAHRFWEETDPAQKANQRIQLLKNVSMLGGLLLAVVDTDGKPGVAWRTQRAGKDAKRAARSAKKDAKRAAVSASGDAGRVTRRAARDARRAAKVAAHDAKLEAKLARARVEAASPL